MRPKTRLRSPNYPYQGRPSWWTAATLLALAAGLALLPACGGSKPILKIGLSAPFTGWDEPVGYSVLHAVRLALRESYQRGGAGGYMLELVALDDKNDPTEATLQARELAVDPDVLAAIGGLDNEATLAAAPAYQKAGLAFVTIGATLRTLTASGYTSVFGLAPRDQALAQAAVDFARSTLQARRAVLVQDPAEEGLGAAIASAARAGGLTIVNTVEVRRWQLSFTGPVAAIRAAQPDLVFFAGRVSEAGPFLAELRAAGVGIPVVDGPAADDPRLAQLAGAAVEGVYVAALTGQAASATFAPAYSALAGSAPSARAILAYDATTLLIAAVDRAARSGRPTRATVLAELARTKAHPGLSGSISFDGAGQNTAAAPAIFALRGKAYPGTLVR